MNKPQVIAIQEKSLDYTLYDSLWLPGTAKIAVMGSRPRGTGAIQIYEITKTELNKIKDLEKSSSIKCGTFGASSITAKHLACGQFDGRMNVWDVDYSSGSASDSVGPVYSVKAHSEIINCIDGVAGLGIGEGAPEIVTGSRDGNVKIWDTRQAEDPVATIQPEAADQRRDCWAVAFGHAYNQHDRVVAAGYDNGDLKLFDLRAMQLRWETNLKNGICSIQFDRKDIEMNKMAVTSLEGKFFVFDMKTQHPSSGFAHLTEKAHDSTVWITRHLPQNRDIFMTTGGSGSVCLWKYNYPMKRVTEPDDQGHEKGIIGTLDLLQNMTISTQPVSSFDWSPDKRGLAICTSFDQTLRLLITTKLEQF